MRIRHNVLSLNTGIFGKEVLELIPAKLRTTDTPCLKIKISYQSRTRDNSQMVTRYTDAFLTQEQVDDLIDILCSEQANDTLIINETNSIEIINDIVKEKIQNYGIKKTHGVFIQINRQDEEGRIFSSMTTINMATKEAMIYYMERWNEQLDYVPDEMDYKDEDENEIDIYYPQHTDEDVNEEIDEEKEQIAMDTIKNS